MQENSLVQLCGHLSKLLSIPAPESPFVPSFPLACLNVLFPSEEQFFNEMRGLSSQEQQWDGIIQFVQEVILQGKDLEIQQIGEQEINQIYEIIVQVAQLIQEEKSKQAKQPDVNKKSKSKSKEKREVKPEIKPEIKAQAKLKENKQKSSQNNAKNTAKPKSSPKRKQSKPPKQKKPQKPLQQQLIEHITSAISKNPQKTNTKSQTVMRDRKNDELVKRQKRRFDYYLQQFKRDGKLKHKQTKKVKKPVQIDQYYLKVLATRQKTMQEDIINQQLKYYMTLRDKKINFINSIHKLTEKLQKERQIDFHALQREKHQAQKHSVSLKLTQAATLFDHNMEMLKESYQGRKKENQLKNYKEIQIAQQIQKAVNKKRKQEMESLKTMWEAEQNKLKLITGDQEKIKSKLIDIYRKNRP